MDQRVKNTVHLFQQLTTTIEASCMINHFLLEVGRTPVKSALECKHAEIRRLLLSFASVTGFSLSDMDGFKSLVREIRSCCQLTKVLTRYQSKNAKGSGASAKRFSKIRSLGLRRKRKVEEGGVCQMVAEVAENAPGNDDCHVVFRSTPCRNWTLRNTHAPKGKIHAVPCISMHQQ